MNNKKKIIDILYWGMMFFSAVKEFVLKFVEKNDVGKFIIPMISERMAQGIPVIQIVGEILLGLIGLTFYSIIIYFWITIPYFIWKFLNLKHIIGKFDKFDYKNEEYYREILKKYTVSEMSYIDDFKLSEKDVVATLMSLEYRGYIVIEDKIKILKLYDENLPEGEYYILDTLNRGNKIDFDVYEKTVEKDCVNSELLEKRKENNNVGKKIAIYMIGMSIWDAYVICFTKISLLPILPILLGVLFLFLYPFVAILSLGIKVSDPYIRTKKAKKLNREIEGLRKYLKDYSNIDERESKEIVLWKEYLIYSVFLGINTKIIDEYKQKLKMN